MCHEVEMNTKVDQLHPHVGIENNLENEKIKSNLIENHNINQILNCATCSGDNQSDSIDDLNRKTNGKLTCSCGKKYHKKGIGVKDDILAMVTQWSRKLFNQINEFYYQVQESNTYKTLTKTAQPAHIIALSILSFVLFTIWPNILESSEKRNKTSAEQKNILTAIIYLGTFATHFGAQIWMTFVSGLALYFALPRHTFGQCQHILFPKYFAMNSVLSVCTLTTFIKMIGGRWEMSSLFQAANLTISAVVEVIVYLYFTPMLLRYMREKYKFEENNGVGREIGHVDPKSLRKCPNYIRIHKNFRKIHMAAATSNLITIACSFFHLYYLASKIQLS